MAASELGMTPLSVSIEIDHYHCNVVVNVPPHTLSDLLYIVVSHLLLPRGLIYGRVDQSLRDALQEFH